MALFESQKGRPLRKIETEIVNKTWLLANTFGDRWKLKFHAVQNYGLTYKGILHCLLLALRSAL